MPAIPQFFKHFVPIITSKLGSGKPDKLSAENSSKETERMRKPCKILRRSSDTYMELDDQTCSKITEDRMAGPRVLTDEIKIDDEEKVISATTEDAMIHDSRHVAPRT